MADYAVSSIARIQTLLTFVRLCALLQEFACVRLVQFRVRPASQMDEDSSP